MLESLRETRERALSIFSLPESMWLEWIKDEEYIINEVDENLQILKLYELALKDYLYERVSKRYCKFLIKLQKLDVLSVEEMRLKYE